MTTKKTTNNATHIATDSEGELITHLEALRTTLMRCLLALGIMLFPSFLFTPACLDFLIKILLSGQQITLNFFSPAEVFILQIKLALVLDILICFPYIARQIWNFVLPALYENERRFIKSIIFSSSLMFILGVIFCLIFILPLIIKFGLSFRTADIKAVLGISNVIGLSLQLAVIFGLMFQFPLITYMLIRSGITSYAAVAAKRPYIFTAILIIAAILTPPDIVSQLMLAVPTYILFELGLYCSRKFAP